MSAASAGPREIASAVAKRDLPRLGLDLDGVVFAFDIGARLALNLHKGTSLQVRESNSWDEIQEQVSRTTWRWLWTDGVRDVFELAPAFPDVVRGVLELQRTMDIVIITHRPDAVADITLRRLGELGIRPREVHHAQYSDKAGVTAPCAVYVDDKPQNVYELTEGHPDATVFFPKKRWNSELHSIEHPQIRGYDDFQTVVSWVWANYPAPGQGV